MNDESKSTEGGADEALRQALSDLADGRADSATVLRVCGAWQSSPQARAQWHGYQLIGDVLRTPDLSPAQGAAGDARFLAGVCARLASEPIVIAPEPLVPPVVQESLMAAAAQGGGARPMTASAAGRGGWRVPAAVAAGVVMVAGAVMIVRGGPGAGDAGPVLAGNQGTPSATVVANKTAPVVGGLAVVAGAPATSRPATTGAVVRDARLDQYLAAHRQFGDGPGAQMPGLAVRSVSTLAPER